MVGFCWLGFFGKKYTGNSKVMNIGGKKEYLPMWPEFVLQMKCDEKTMSIFKK